MATLYAKAAGGNWSAAGTWSNVSSSGVDSSGPPAAADNVILELGSGTVTVNTSGLVCRSLDTTSGTGSFTGTLDITGQTLTIGDATAGAGNVALKLNASMTVTKSATSVFSFNSTSATPQTVTTAGRLSSSTASYTINGAGNSIQFADTVNVNNITLTSGTLDFNGQGVTIGNGLAISGSTARTLTLGSSAISLTSAGNAWSAATTTNLTVTANTAVVTLSNGAGIFQSGNQNWNGLSVVFTGAGISTFGTSGATVTVANLTRTGTAVKTDQLSIASAASTITGTFTVNGNSAVNRVSVYSNGVGTARTISAATTSFTNTIFRDITASGAGNWNLSAQTDIGDAGGNTGITFPASATQTATGTGAFTWSTHGWTSRVPLPQDDVVVSNAFTGSPTVTMDMPHMGRSVTFAGSSGTVSFTLSSATSIYGSLTLANNVAPGGSSALTFEGRGAYTFTTAGKTISWGSLGINAPGGTITQQDAVSWSGGGTWCAPCVGTWDTNQFNFTGTNTGGQMVTGSTGTLNIVNSTITCPRTTATIWSIASTNTLNATGSTINMTASSTGSASLTFNGAGKTYGTVQFNTAGSAQQLTITGANTIANLIVGSGKGVTFPSATTTNLTSWGSSGVNNGYLQIPAFTANYASTPSSVATSITGDMEVIVRAQFDSFATGGPIFTQYGSGAAGTRAWRLTMAVGGAFIWGDSTDGALAAYNATIVSQANVLAALSVGTTYWLRITVEVNNAGNRVITAYYAADQSSVPSSWTAFTGGVLNSISAATTGTASVPIEMGSITGGGTATLQFKLYRAILKNGIAGTIAFDADFTAKTVGANTFTDSSTNAATVTINGVNAQNGDGRISINSSTGGTTATINKSGLNLVGDYLVVQDSTVTGVTPAYAGSHGVLVSNTTNWLATDQPAGQGNQSLLLMGVGG